MANAGLRYFSQYNGYMPQASGQVIGFIRAVNKFRLWMYAQPVPTPTVKGFYLYMGRDLPVRLPSNNGNPATGSPDPSVWSPGSSRKTMGEQNQALFTSFPFETTRRNQSAHVDWLTASQAKGSGLDLFTWYSQALASMNMTLLTQITLTQMLTSSNWPTNHAQDVTTLNGGLGTWDKASDDPNSPRYNAIRQTLMAATEQILLDTNGQIEEEDLILVVSPDLARKMSAAPEVVNYVRETPYAKDQVEGRVKSYNSKFGLPDILFGMETVVENAVVVAQLDQLAASGGVVEATANRRFIMTGNSAFITTRVGAGDGIYGAPNWSTCQIYYYDGSGQDMSGEEQEAAGPGGLMVVETFGDAEDRLSRLHVSHNVAAVAPTYTGYSGMLLTNCY